MKPFKAHAPLTPSQIEACRDIQRRILQQREREEILKRVHPHHDALVGNYRRRRFKKPLAE